MKFIANYILGISLFMLLTIFFGCRQKGCLAVDADNFDPNASVDSEVCTFRYLTRIQVNKLRDIKSGAESWDSGDAANREGAESKPDLRFYLKSNESEEWQLITDLKPECCNALPVSWQIDIAPNDFLRMNEIYSYQFVDEDVIGEDIIISGKFIPYWDYLKESNRIRLTNTFNTVEIDLIYEVY